MPPKRKRSIQVKRRRRYNRRRRQYAKKLTPPTASGQLIGYPKQRVVKMRYVETFNLNSLLGVMSSLVFRANSINDPYYGVGGTSPTGYTIWSTMYQRYCVIGSKISARIAFHNNDGLPTQVGVMLENTPALISTTNTDLLERTGRCQVLTLNPYVNGGQTNRNVVCKFSAKKFFNIQDIKDNQSRIGSPFGDNPADVNSAFYILWHKATLGGNTSAVAVVKIDYIALVSEPRLLES